MNTTTFKQKIANNLNYTAIDLAEKIDEKALLRATCLSVNETIFEQLQQTNITNQNIQSRSVNYLSLEYLMGRMLSNNLHNLGLFDIASQAVKSFGYELEDICEHAHDLALGNGGLGRLAACYLDSLATLDFNAIGYGIHYEHGLFEQQFHHGRQIETPDEWREYGNPWEVCRPQAAQEIPLYGYVDTIASADGTTRKQWHPGQTIKGIPWDIPIVGYQTQTVNTLRLWESRASSHFDWSAFNAGEYQSAHSAQTQAETISKVLYPNDDSDAGKELRFIQQYFFCACSIKDIIRRYQQQYPDNWNEFTNQVVIQLNDTHPAIAILELMRALVDDYAFEWAEAWATCQKIFAYTNHTLLPEALEKWSVALFEKVLPRHLEILYQINQSFLDSTVAQLWPDNIDMRRKLSLIEEGDTQMVRMAHLCVITSFKVNGVAEIHSRLVKQDLFPEFNQIWPQKLTNVTNGITPRRWLKACNPKLAQLIDQTIVGGDWAKSLALLKQLEKYAKDPRFQNQFMAIKHDNKVKLATHIKQLLNITVSPAAIFDVHIKRLHEYKRQHLNLLHILALYRRLLENPNNDCVPRVFIFAAKAAPGYFLAKEIIYAINCVAQKINHDTRINNKLKVIFIPNYRVSLAEKIIPAADVSEQISTAGKEASGTGNMKLSLNGAITIGTLDGANIEIAEEVGDENIFIFGNTVEQIKQLESTYNPYHYYQQNEEIKACLDWLDTDYFTPGKPGELSSIKQSLLEGGDPYKVLADFESYSEKQQQLNDAYKNTSRWAEMSILNTAMMGKFTSDRAIEEYAKNIWSLQKNQYSQTNIESIAG